MTRNPVVDRFDPDNTGRAPDHRGFFPDQHGDIHRRGTASPHGGRSARPAAGGHPHQTFHPGSGHQAPGVRDHTTTVHGHTGAHAHVARHNGAPLEPLPPGFPPHGFWASLTREERHAFSVAATTTIYAAGSVLWAEGEPAGHLLVILSGYVRVSVIRDGHERIVATRGPGDIIGERAALLLRQRSAGVTALDVVRTLRMTTRQFAAFLSEHPRVLAVLERELYGRLTEGRAAFTGPASQHDLAASAPYTPSPAPPELGGAYRTPAWSAAGCSASVPASAPGSVPGSVTGLAQAPPAGAVPPPPGAAAPSGCPSWAGQMCTIMFVDVAGFSAPHRTDDDRLAVRRVMYALLREAFAASGVPWDDCHREDRGDGAMIIVPPEVPTRAVVDPLIADLTAGLRRHNRRCGEAVRFQLRVALHVGPVTHDAEGVAGSAVIHTARLLDAPVLKEWLARTRSDLGFITSAFVYENVIAHAPGQVVPASYQQVNCTVKESHLTAWMHLSSSTAAA